MHSKIVINARRFRFISVAQRIDYQLGQFILVVKNASH